MGCTCMFLAECSLRGCFSTFNNRKGASGSRSLLPTRDATAFPKLELKAPFMPASGIDDTCSMTLRRTAPLAVAVYVPVVKLTVHAQKAPGVYATELREAKCRLGYWYRNSRESVGSSHCNSWGFSKASMAASASVFDTPAEKRLTLRAT